MLLPRKSVVCIFKTLFGIVFQAMFRNSRVVESSSVFHAGVKGVRKGRVWG